MTGRILLAAPMGDTDSVLDPMIADLRAASFQVATLALDHRCEDEELETRFLEALALLGGAEVIGGFSLGARIAARVAQQSQARGLLCVAYPFHKKGDPGSAHGLASLKTLTLATLIVQGTRDSHGGRATLKGYGALPDNIEVHWLEDGNHDLMPRQKMPLTRQEHLAAAGRVGLDFVERTLVSRAP